MAAYQYAVPGYGQPQAQVYAAAGAPQQQPAAGYQIPAGYDAATYAAAVAAAQAQQQQQQQQQGQQQQGQQQAAPQSEETIGSEAKIQVTGCTHATVGGIVRGTFTLSGDNHGKPAYKKDSQVNGLDVMLYFWDERDGPNFCGWWFGPKIGGDQVWAYHPSRTQTPSKTGWKVPYDGPVDTTFLISSAQGMGGAAAQRPAAGMYGQQQPQQQQQGWPQQGQQQQAGFGNQQQMAAQIQALKQQEEMKKRQAQMENVKKLEDMRRAQQAQQQQLQQRQFEENKRKLEEANQKRLEEQRKKMEDTKRQQEEQRAVMNIRRVIAKVKTCIIDNYEVLKKELEDVLQKDLDACGSQKPRIQEEAMKGLEAGTTRKDQLVAAKAEEEAKKAKAEELLKELEEALAEAEAAAATLKEKAEPFSGSALDFKKVTSLKASLDTVAEEAKAKVKACQDFIATNAAAMKVAPVGPDKLNLQKAQTRLTAALASNARQQQVVDVAMEKAGKAEAAKKVITAREKLFGKYNLSKDGFLKPKEVQKYAKTEFKFTLSQAATDKIFKVFNEDGQQAGISKVQFQGLKVSIGIEREKEKDEVRRTERLAKEAELAARKAEIQEEVKSAEKDIDEAAELVVKAEKAAAVLPAKAKAADATAPDLLKLVEEVDELVKEAKEGVTGAKTTTTALNEASEPELKAWLAGEVSKLQKKMASFDGRIATSVNLASRCRDDAKKKESQELEKIEKAAVAMIKYHQTTKKLSNTAVFDAIDNKKDDSIDKAEFLAFFETCEKKEEATAPSTADLERLFTCLCEDEDAVSKDKFSTLVRVFMKVAKDTVITSGATILEGTNLRRLEAGEILEILEGPIEEDTVHVMRVHAKAMKDDVDGWVSVAGNQGSVFLEDGGNLWKVIKETILTESFELDGDSSKDATRKLKDTTRKLKVGEIVEVREWPKKEEKSGLTRMKCKAKSDGVVGWVTTIGNQTPPITFLQVV